MPRRPGSVAVAVLLTGSLAGCQVIAGFTGLEDAPPSSSTTTTGTGGSAGGPATGGGAVTSSTSSTGGSGGQGVGGGGGCDIACDPCAPLTAGVVHVDADASAGGDGAAWTGALSSLSEAFDLAATCSGVTEVWVAEGVYTPGSAMDDTFALPQGVAVYGGFEGDEAARGDRDPSAHRTILSGDLALDDTADAGVVQHPDGIVGDNARHVVTIASDGITLDGFTVTAGSASGSDVAGRGGGILITGTSPTLRDLIVIGNRASSLGGGLCATNGDLIAEHVSFISNEAGTDGGGLVARSGSDVTLSAVSFIGNEAAARGGGMALLEGTHTAHNVVLRGNAAGTDGGGAFADSAGLTLVHASVVGNKANSGGGLANAGSAVTWEITNSLVWGNSDSNGTAVLSASLVNGGATPLVRSSVIEASGGSASWDTNAGTDGGSNTDEDPRVVQLPSAAAAPTTDGDAHLLAVSPAINAGDASLSVATEDRDGRARVRYAAADQGAYELGGPCGGAVAYVDASATGEGTGDSWADAFRSLQTGMFHAEACGGIGQVWAAAGTYTPGNLPRDSFVLQDGLAVLGGFDGTETMANEADPTANLTILSGDIDGDDGASGVLTDPSQIAGGNSNHVVEAGGTGATARLDGFSITAGQANLGATLSGGAILIGDGTPTLARLVISGNAADQAGAVHCDGGEVNLTDSRIAFNSATDGGGVNLAGGCVATFTRVDLVSNTASTGGGLQSNASTLNWTGGLIQSNEATVFIGGAGYLLNSNVTLTGVEVRGNEASSNTTNGWGGGFTITFGTVTFDSCLLAGNRAAARGGALTMDRATVRLINTTLSGNRGNDGGAIHIVATSAGDYELVNSIVWGNQDATGVGTAAASIVNEDPTRLDVHHSVVQGAGNSGAFDAGIGMDLLDNQDVDPLFTLPSAPGNAPTLAGDYTLMAASPVLDDGDDGAPIASLDLAGNVRFVGTVDLGAYERP